MKTVMCDVCRRCEPDVDCKYNRRMKFGWFRYEYDGNETRIDMCEDCYEGFKKYMQCKLEAE